MIFIKLLDTTTGLKIGNRGKITHVPKVIKPSIGMNGFYKLDARYSLDKLIELSKDLLEKNKLNKWCGLAIYSGSINNNKCIYHYIKDDHKHLKIDLTY